MCIVISVAICFFIHLCSASTPAEIREKLTTQVVSFLKYSFEREDDYDAVAHLDVQFSLFPQTSTEFELLYINDKATLKSSSFDINKSTIIVIHGYTDNRDRTVLVRLRNEMIKNLDANIIALDWRIGANQIYFSAVNNTVPVGRVLGEFLTFLEESGVDLDKVHLIGHSLGAQIAGMAGDYVNGKIGRITGLDPAGPLYEVIEIRNNSLSLDTGDAKFVDVIHTAIGTFGIIAPIGHVDFYPNHGAVPQPGCINIFLAVTCSHLNSIEYFIESIWSDVPFLGRRCDNFDEETKLVNCNRKDVTPMGYYADKNARGMYYLQTNEASPFSRGGKIYV